MNARRSPSKRGTDPDDDAAGRYWVDAALAEGMEPWLVIKPDGSRHIGTMKSGVVPTLTGKGQAAVEEELLRRGRVWSRRQEAHMADKAPARDIERFREIARESGDNALLSDGPVSADAELLDICSEALHLLVRIAKTREVVFQRREALAAAVRSGKMPMLEHGDRDPEEQKVWDESYADGRKAEPILRRIRKIRAHTAAGIYAKALVVRASDTGAPVLAKSLAEDLIACEGLRASLWPAPVE